MSISPPTDIVLDVARAADPARYSAAAARLGTAPTGVAEAFATAMAAETPKASHAVVEKAPANPATTAAKADQDFEAMALSNLLEDAMPDDGASFFGEGTAGGVWKSMLVEQIAGQMAKAGGIGIAAEIARGARTALADTGSGDAAREATKTLLIDRIQRGFVGGDGSQKAPKVSL